MANLEQIINAAVERLAERLNRREKPVGMVTINEAAEYLALPVPEFRKRFSRRYPILKPERRGIKERVSWNHVEQYLQEEIELQVMLDCERKSADVRKTLESRNRGPRVRRNRAVAGD
jgi:hypothetical protein